LSESSHYSGFCEQVNIVFGLFSIVGDFGEGVEFESWAFLLLTCVVGGETPRINGTGWTGLAGRSAAAGHSVDCSEYGETFVLIKRRLDSMVLLKICHLLTHKLALDAITQTHAGESRRSGY
jgi:hypothetical protein